ncbi:hypothetical protein BC829DRAFT_57092 [Chytridium lagenaria]|nr:hypothetical protein BC829DRAFT_57092 [Chytridium lagenaria]
MQTKKMITVLFFDFFHIGNTFNPEAVEAFGQMTMFLGSLLKNDLTISSSDMIELLCRISCNSISVCDGELVNLGVGMFPKLAIFNHSCWPNCAITFKGSRAYLRSIREIQSDEELTTSYIDLASSREARQQELQSRFFFVCSCQLCLKQENSISLANVQELDTTIETLIASNSTSFTEFAKLYKILETKLPKISIPMLRFKRAFFDVLLAQQDWFLARKISEDICVLIHELFPEGHPQLGIQLFATAKIAFLLEPMPTEASISTLRKSVAALEASHGLDHDLTRQAKEKLHEVTLFSHGRSEF